MKPLIFNLTPMDAHALVLRALALADKSALACAALRMIGWQAFS